MPMPKTKILGMYLSFLPPPRMEQTVFPASAETGADSLAALQERLRALEAQRRGLDAAINGVRDQVDAVMRGIQEQAKDERRADPRTLEDFQLDASYEEDRSYEAPVRDQERLAVTAGRLANEGRAVSLARRLRGDVDVQQAVLRDGPARLAAMRAEITRIDGSLLARMGSAFTGKRRTLLEDAAALEKSVAQAPALLETARAALAAAETRAAGNANARYDSSLSEAPRLAVLPRASQAVGITVSFNGNSGGQVTLLLPATPESDEYGVTFELDLEYGDMQDFLDYIGRDVAINDVFNTVGDNADIRYGFENALVPMALEVVDAGGERKVRLPQAFWEKFGPSAV